MKIYALKIESPLPNKIFNILMHYASNEKHDKIKRFIKRIDAERSLLSDLLARIAIMETLKIPNRDISFYHNLYGKPFLNNYEGFHFNLSHSGSWVVCAIDDNPIGIDIEKIGNIDLSVSKYFFSAEEHLDLMNKTYSERHSYFFDLWTLKESYIKALGSGLSLPLDSFSIRVLDGNIFLEANNEFNKCYFKQYNIDNNYKMSLCSLNNIFPSNICIKTIEGILTDLHMDSLIKAKS